MRSGGVLGRDGGGGSGGEGRITRPHARTRAHPHVAKEDVRQGEAPPRRGGEGDGVRPPRGGGGQGLPPPPVICRCRRQVLPIKGRRHDGRGRRSPPQQRLGAVPLQDHGGAQGVAQLRGGVVVWGVWGGGGGWGASAPRARARGAAHPHLETSGALGICTPRKVSGAAHLLKRHPLGAWRCTRGTKGSRCKAQRATHSEGLRTRRPDQRRSARDLPHKRQHSRRSVSVQVSVQQIEDRLQVVERQCRDGLFSVDGDIHRIPLRVTPRSAVRLDGDTAVHLA